MAQFAPVAPIQILEKMKEERVLGKYHLLLTHHILEHPERFKELFADLKQCTIIVDNSIVELGDAATDDKVLEACKVLQESSNSPNYIIPVLKDVMNDGPATREAATASCNWWLENAPTYNPMVVIQGETWREFTKTADHFLSNSDLFPNIEYAGIPRVLVSHQDTRQKAIQYITALSPMTNIHLLGFSDDVTDDIICANDPNVEGIDSAVPIRYSFSATGGDTDKLYTPSAKLPPRPADWFEKGEFTVDDEVNLYNIRKWVA